MKSAFNFLEAPGKVISKDGSLPDGKSPTIHSTIPTNAKNAHVKKRQRKSKERFWSRLIRILLAITFLNSCVSMLADEHLLVYAKERKLATGCT
jgi:hypothetical protein